MPTVAGTNYPSLTTIANLVRSIVNDDKMGATGTPGEGRILTNSSVTLQNFMNSAIRDLYRDIRIQGQPTLIKDNYIITGLPPVNSINGLGIPNPEVQTSITFTGYFDGLEIQPNYFLPNDLILPLEVWAVQTGTGNPFKHIQQVTGPLASKIQTVGLSEWEWRQDAIWMVGSTVTQDIRIRYVSTYVDLVAPSINWDTTYVPIMDCQEAVADKVAVRYAARLGGPALATAQLAAKESLLKIRQEFTRSRQKIDLQLGEWGRETGYEDVSALLY